MIKVSVRFWKRIWHAKLLINDAWFLKWCHWQMQSIWSVVNRSLKNILLSLSWLLTAELYACDLDMSSLNLLQDYLANREKKWNRLHLHFLERCFIWSTIRLYVGSPFAQYIYVWHVLDIKDSLIYCLCRL